MLQFSGRLSCVCALLWAAGVALADPLPAPERLDFVAPLWEAADDAQLDAMRGGFDLGTVNPGLAISFGFARTVSINGALVSESRFSLPDLTRITADQARQVGEAMGQVQLVQNGIGNGAPADLTSSSLATTAVVQNSLNNQTIQTLTQIDAGVNSLGQLRAIQSQGVLRDALLGAVGVR